MPVTITIQAGSITFNCHNQGAQALSVFLKY